MFGKYKIRNNGYKSSRGLFHFNVTITLRFSLKTYPQKLMFCANEKNMRNKESHDYLVHYPIISEKYFPDTILHITQKNGNLELYEW